MFCILELSEEMWSETSNKMVNLVHLPDAHASHKMTFYSSTIWEFLFFSLMENSYFDQNILTVFIVLINAVFMDPTFLLKKSKIMLSFWCSFNGILLENLFELKPKYSNSDPKINPIKIFKKLQIHEKPIKHKIIQLKSENLWA